jgi:hypothetical protein
MSAHRFAGEAGQLLWRTLHWSSIFAGALALALGAAAALLLARIPNGSALLPSALACLGFAIVARVALDGRASASIGSLWRGRGAGPGQLLRALGRIALGNLLWLIPAAVVLQSSRAATTLEDRLVPLAVAALMALLLPPLLLVVALAAQSWTELLQARHWQRQLGGRGADVVALYSTYLGATLGLGLPLWAAVLGFGGGQARLTIFLALVAGSYHAGTALLLLGRLIAGYLLTGSGPQVVEISSDALSQEIRAVHVERGAASVEPGRAALAARRPPMQAREAAPPPAADADTLLGRLRQIERLAAEDPGAALSQLVQLRQERGPQTLLLTRTAVLEHQLGMPSALAIAKDAVKLARQSANTGALAELQAAFGEQSDRIGIEPQDWLRIAAVHVTMGREREAVALLTRALEAGVESGAAVKTLLKLAQAQEKHDRDLESALAIYATILQKAPEHPFAEYAERGKAAIERRLERAV